MWFVLCCYSGEEENIMHSLRQHISNEILKDVFVFTCERMKRFQGQWHVEIMRMFPNYIFVESDDEKKLSQELERYRDIVQIMEDRNMLFKVSAEEERLLRLLGGRNHHLQMSKGCIRDGVTYIKEGPLKGMENRIRKIDRHKRLARLDAPTLYSGYGVLMAGLEIVEKS